MSTIPATVCALLISGYQRSISPHKGFRCAYGVLNGGPSCSDVIKADVLAQGFRWNIFAEQFARCRNAALQIHRFATETEDQRRKETFEILSPFEVCIPVELPDITICGCAPFESW
jgi:putative component of membrane protein insertase Oxa1/YidC/SpoIIIJ protein YidD